MTPFYAVCSTTVRSTANLNEVCAAIHLHKLLLRLENKMAEEQLLSSYLSVPFSFLVFVLLVAFICDKSLPLRRQHG